VSHYGYLVFEIQKAAQQAVAADVASLRCATRLNRAVIRTRGQVTMRRRKHWRRNRGE